MRKIPQHVREKQLRELAEADGYSFVGWVDGYVNAHSELTVTCPEHGSWVTTVNRFVDAGKRCLGCSGRQTISQAERERSVTVLAEADGYAFVGWSREFNNGKSKMVMRCSTHGEWVTTIGNFVTHGKRCSGCSSNRPIPQSDRETSFRLCASGRGYTFIGWDTEYVNAASKAILSCPEHGEWCVSSVNFVSGGKGCPSCAVTGYRPSLPGTLYALMSECRTMIKIGISNVPDKRHIELRYDTPFQFIVHRQIHCDDGSQPPMLERIFHDQFPGAGLRGFDGATEWRQMNPDIDTWFDLFGAQ